MTIFGNQHIAVAFCSPHRKISLPNGKQIVDTITWEWHQAKTALAVGTNCNFMELFENGKEVGEARDSAVRRCLEHKPQPRYLFFLDDDVLPSFDAFVKLLRHMEWNPEIDIATGVYACKTLCEPLIYKGNGVGPFWDWAVGDILTTAQHGITGTHMGLTLIRVGLFQRMLDAKLITDDVPFYKTVREQASATTKRSGTEDLYFYSLAGQLDPPVQILVDTSVLAGHIDKDTGITWGLPVESPPIKRAKWLGNKDREEAVAIHEHQDGRGLDAVVHLKLAIDLGAGGRRREWDGYQTYTLDIRADAKPDYCQDTRSLNFPENHWDLVASNHHLEHIGRWDQEQVFREMFRITKPGGKWEHIVPNLEWAAAKIADGQTDEHVMNVLYGAQESHGYGRIYNTHFMGFTKTLLAALAEQAGMVDIQTEDYRDNEANGYNLVLRCSKPNLSEMPKDKGEANVTDSSTETDPANQHTG